MANHTSLASLFTDIANAIRAKLGSNASIVADNFPAAIQSIAPTLETVSKTYTPSTSQQSDTITPGQGYDGIGEVDVTVNAMPTGSLGGSVASRSISGNYLETRVTWPNFVAGYIGSHYPIALLQTIQNETVTPSESQQVITPSGTLGFNYLESVTVDPIPSEYIVPSGNIDITSAGTTDVTNYATATVATVQPYVDFYNNEFFTNNDQRYWHIQPYTEVDEGEGDTAGFFANGRRINGDYYEAFAIPSGTSVTPTESAQTIGGSQYMMEGAVTVNAIPSNYVGSGVTRRDYNDLSIQQDVLYVPEGYYSNDSVWLGNMMDRGAPSASVSLNTSTGLITATASIVGNDSNTNYVYASKNNTDTDTLQLTTRTSSDLTASGATVSVPSGFYENNASKAVASGTEGTPTATKGAVSNHAVTVTPAVTNAAGYIQGGTHSGTPVTVSASELVSGSETKTQNGTYDVTNLAELVVDVSGGGGSSMMVSTATKTLAAAASSIQFAGLSGEPTSFVVTSAADQSTGGTKAVAVVYDGTSCHGIDLTTQAEADTGFTQSYSNGTLTITATTASFQANEYKLVYSYGGTGGNIGTADVQVGSGATSITFTGLSDEPEYFSCIFKSTFSTSNGYQRVMEVVYDGTNIYGHALDSSAHALTSWTWSYNNGSLTITSTGTNNGGYFHQPGYYQLTYAIGGDQTLQTKTVTPTEQTQNVTADTAQGYTALKKVVVNPIPSEYVVPSGNLPITQNGNNIDVTNYASVSVNVSGGGGGTVGTGSATLQTAGNSISFTNLSGTPKAWFIRCTTQVSSSGSTTYYYIIAARYNGTNTQGTLFRIGSTRRIQNQTSGLSYTYNNGTLTITSSAEAAGQTPGFFYNGTYELTYVY